MTGQIDKFLTDPGFQDQAKLELELELESVNIEFGLINSSPASRVQPYQYHSDQAMRLC